MNIIKYTILQCLCISVIFFSNTSHAKESYQTEFSLVYNLSSEKKDNYKSELYGVSSKVHFSQVDSEGHPYLEAAFLERIGSFELLVGKREIESSTFAAEAKGDGPLYGAMFTYMKPHLPIAILAMYAKSKVESDSLIYLNVKSDIYGIEIGRFLSDSLLSSIGLYHSETDLTIRETTLIFGPGFSSEWYEFNIDTTIKQDDFELSVKSVKEKMDGTAYNLEVSLRLIRHTYYGSSTFIVLSGDYYFNPRISLMSELESSNGSFRDQHIRFALGLNTFVTPSFSINFIFEKKPTSTRYYVGETSNFVFEREPASSGYYVGETSFYFGILARF